MGTLINSIVSRRILLIFCGDEFYKIAVEPVGDALFMANREDLPTFHKDRFYKRAVEPIEEALSMNRMRARIDPNIP